MSIFDRFFGREKQRDTDYGYEVMKLINNYLKNNDNLEPNAYTFTEMFAFVYIMIDMVIYSRQIPNREKISGDLLKFYSMSTMVITRQKDTTKYFEAFDARVDKYALMLKARKEPADMIEELDRLLKYASVQNEFYVDGEAILIEDAFNNFQNRLTLSEFYDHQLLPFIEVVLEREA